MCSRYRYFFIALIVLILGCLVLQAQSSSPAAANQQSGNTSKQSSTSAQPQQGQNPGEQDPLKRPRRASDKNAIKEKLEGPYKKWLDEDVRWIITDEELAAFKKLSNNAERDQFIEQFWLRRDPTPDTAE